MGSGLGFKPGLFYGIVLKDFDCSRHQANFVPTVHARIVDIQFTGNELLHPTGQLHDWTDNGAGHGNRRQKSND